METNDTIMNKEKAERVRTLVGWIRLAILLVLLIIIGSSLCHAQGNDSLVSLHGILRGKYEYQPEMNAGRYEVRNARMSIDGHLSRNSQYKLEVDLCDESSIKMKDAWVRLTPWKSLRLSIGQQRLPFTIDAHRNPANQYFANRSFIAKQVGDMRDVGFQAGYTFQNSKGRNVAVIDAGIFNGSNLDNQKTAWNSQMNFSARLQLFPTKTIAIVPSIQRTSIANQRVHYTSLNLGAFVETGGLHLEAEVLNKHYDDNAYDDCMAFNGMALYKMPIRNKKNFFQSIAWLGRYDYMDNHADGKKGFVMDDKGQETSRLVTSDYARHRMTLGMTLGIRNPYLPTELHLNYERYWYKKGGIAKESEQDKLVAELMIRF